MQLNWKVRIRNKLFWLALIPAALILVETVCRLFGVTVETGDLKEQLLNLVNAVFAVLAVLGIVVDPTTEGLSDSDRAMGYDIPYSDADVSDPSDPE